MGTPRQYHTGVGQSARAQFGVPDDDYQSYFPSTLTPDEYNQAVYRMNPAYSMETDTVLQKRIKDAAEAEQFADEKQITGLARLMGRGVIDPKQGAAMAAIADRAERSRDRQEAMDMRREYAEEQQKMREIQRRNQMFMPKLVSSYISARKDPTVDEKIAEFKKQTKKAPKADSKEDWSRAWDMTQGKAERDFAAQMEAAAANGVEIAPEFSELRSRIKIPSDQPAAVKPLPAASLTREQVLALPSGTPIMMPDGSIKHKK